MWMMDSSDLSFQLIQKNISWVKRKNNTAKKDCKKSEMRSEYFLFSFAFEKYYQNKQHDREQYWQIFMSLPALQTTPATFTSFVLCSARQRGEPIAPQATILDEKNTKKKTRNENKASMELFMTINILEIYDYNFFSPWYEIVSGSEFIPHRGIVP